MKNRTRSIPRVVQEAADHVCAFALESLPPWALLWTIDVNLGLATYVWNRALPWLGDVNKEAAVHVEPLLRDDPVLARLHDHLVAQRKGPHAGPRLGLMELEAHHVGGEVTLTFRLQTRGGVRYPCQMVIDALSQPGTQN
jgi:hypothetical protein